MGNGGDIMLDSGHSEAGSSGTISLTSASSDHLSGSIALSTGTGKQGSSGTISLETGSSDHSAGGIKLQVGDTFGYRNGGGLNDIMAVVIMFRFHYSHLTSLFLYYFL